MSGGIGLGLGLGSMSLESPSSSITVPAPSVTKNAFPKPTHPAYQVPITERSHRGPRSLGVDKRFVSSPSKTLPPTIYDKSTSNPLSIPPTSSTSASEVNGNSKPNLGRDMEFNFPINSPQLGLDLVNINPTQHLRQMKKRSLSNKYKRDFGLSANDPLNRMNQPASMTLSNGVHSASSPTIGSSPTLSSTPIIGSSPIMSSSPIPNSQENSQHHIDMLGPSIALSVVLSLLVLGVASWVGIHYRRKRLTHQNYQQESGDGEEGEGEGNYGRRRRVSDSDEKSFTSEMFNASNVVEKGLKPKSSKNINSGNQNNTYNDNENLRSSFISYKRPLSSIQPSSESGGGRRVSFVDTVNYQDEDGNSQEMYYVEEGGSSGRNRRESCLPPPRFMIASLHQPEIDHNDDEEAVEEDDNDGEEETEPPVPSPRSSIAPTLEMIEEEAEEEEPSLSNQGTEQNQPEAESQDGELEGGGESIDRRNSMMSCKSSSSESSTCSGDYTTASARSSISSLSALSIISSSFPQTPRDQSTPPPGLSQHLDDRDQDPSSSSSSKDKTLIGGMESPNVDGTAEMGMGIYDSPTPTSKFQSRRKRAQSQGANSKMGLVEVQKHDLLRTAVGRTMSLQPTKEVREFIRIMTMNNGNNQIELENIPAVPIPPKMINEKPSMMIKDKEEVKEIDHFAKLELSEQRKAHEDMEDLRIAAFISSQLEEKVSKEFGIKNDDDDNTEDMNGRSKIARSTSFPSKLLQRRKSSASTTGTTHSQSHLKGSRKSEIISSSTDNGGGYLKRALKAFKGDGDGEGSGESVPALPSTYISDSPDTSNTKSRSRSRSRSNSACPPPDLPALDEASQQEQEETIKALAERQIQLEHYLALIQSEGQSQLQSQTKARIRQSQEKASRVNREGVVKLEEKAEDPYQMTKNYFLQQIDNDHQEEEEEEVDMEIEDVRVTEEEEEDVDSVWDPDAYAQEEEGVAFEDHYIHFEGDDEEEIEYQDGAFETSSYYQEEEDQEEGFDINGNGNGLTHRVNQHQYSSNKLPHIRVTSH